MWERNVIAFLNKKKSEIFWYIFALGSHHTNCKNTVPSLWKALYTLLVVYNNVYKG